MTEIYLIRHAQAEGNLYRMMQGHWDGDLTELGLKQAEELGHRFENIHIDAVYSSDLRRTRLTIEPVCRRHRLALNTDKRLREINVGPWETGFFADISYETPELMRKFIADQESWYLEGAETYMQVQKRAFEALCELAAAHDGQSIAIASHGITIRCILSKISGISINDGVKLPVFGNTAVTRLFYDKGSFTIDYMNDSSHLDGMEIPQWGKASMLRTESFDPASDKDYYCACYEDAWLSAHGSLECFTPGPYYRSAIEHYALNSRAVQRVFDGDKSAGLIDLDTQRGAHAGYGWISLIYLKEEYRRRGCGIQLLARAMVLYRALGRKSLRLHVAEDNTDALAFYRRWGFEEISREGNSLGSLILMEKPIGGSRNEN